MRRSFVLLPLLLVCITACARVEAVRTGEVEPTGRFDLQFVYEDNACFSEWPARGTVLSGVELRFEGEPERLRGFVEGVLGVYIEIVLGTREMLGQSVSGRVSLRLDGRYSSELAGCAFVYGLDLEAILAGDAIEGSVVFSRRLAETALCDDARCESTLTFTGRRHPPIDASVDDAGALDAPASDVPMADAVTSDGGADGGA